MAERFNNPGLARLVGAAGETVSLIDDMANLS